MNDDYKKEFDQIQSYPNQNLSNNIRQDDQLVLFLYLDFVNKN